MVYLRDPNPLSQKVQYYVCDSNSYWKLGLDTPFEYNQTLTDSLRAYLQERGYYPSKGKQKKADLLDLLCRYQRGLLLYENHNIKTLKKLCESRRLACSSSKHDGRSELIRALKEADETSTFNGLFDLPAEVRNAIYTYHFESFGLVPLQHDQPPLTKACKQLRAEALPLFYSVGTFKFDMAEKSEASTYLTPAWEPRLTCRTSVLEQFDGALFARIRRISLVFGSWPGARNPWDIVVEYPHRQHAGLGVWVRSRTFEHDAERSENRFISDAIRASLRAMVERKQPWNTGWRLQGCDLFDLQVAALSGIRTGTAKFAEAV